MAHGEPRLCGYRHESNCTTGDLVTFKGWLR